MQNRGAVYVAILLIVGGALLLAINLAPRLTIANTWPVIFYILSAAFFLPPILWPEKRRGLSGLIIPASILLTLGILFSYNVGTRDWSAWAFAWVLIVAGVGMGLALASAYGRWSSTTTWVGVWMLLGSLVFFALFAGIFGSPLLKIVSPILLLLAGIILLLRGIMIRRA